MRAAVNNTFAVGGVERVCDLNGNVQQPVQGERFSLHARRQGLAFEQFHGDEGLPIVLINRRWCKCFS